MAKFKPTSFMAENSKYNKSAADYAVNFIQCLSHTKGTWAGKKFELLDWQERVIHDLFGVLKPNGYRQFNTAYIEIPKKNGKMRPLSIPCMKDRAMQTLYKFALEPIAEITADPNSYGFRAKRCVQDAIEQCFTCLNKGKSPKWVLEGDIKVITS